MSVLLNKIRKYRYPPIEGEPVNYSEVVKELALLEMNKYPVFSDEYADFLMEKANGLFWCGIHFCGTTELRLPLAFRYLPSICDVNELYSDKLSDSTKKLILGYDQSYFFIWHEDANHYEIMHKENQEIVYTCPSFESLFKDVFKVKTDAFLFNTLWKAAGNADHDNFSTVVFLANKLKEKGISITMYPEAHEEEIRNAMQYLAARGLHQIPYGYISFLQQISNGVLWDYNIELYSTALQQTYGKTESHPVIGVMNDCHSDKNFMNTGILLGETYYDYIVYNSIEKKYHLICRGELQAMDAFDTLSALLEKLLNDAFK